MRLSALKQAPDLILTAYRYIEKFYDMRSQLQKISLRLQVHLSTPYSGHPSLKPKSSRNTSR